MLAGMSFMAGLGLGIAATLLGVAIFGLHYQRKQSEERSGLVAALVRGGGANRQPTI